MNRTRRDIAKFLLRETDLGRLRAKVQTDKLWRDAFPGFRPAHVPRDHFLRSTAQFAQNLALLESLCGVYLDSLGVAPSPDLSIRLRTAVADPNQTEEARAILADLVSIPLSILAPSAPAREQDVVTPANPLSSLETPARLDPHVTHTTEEHLSEGPQADNSIDIDASIPGHVRETVQLDWQPPNDHVTEVQQAVTMFERALVEFVQRQLAGLHGDRWLERGCPMHKDWKAKAGRSVTPRTVLGYAELGDLRDIMVSNTNWSAFKAYFQGKDWLRRQFDDVLPLRVSAAHAGQRELRLLDQASGLSAMVSVVRGFHGQTADSIHRLFETMSPRTTPEPESDIDPPTQTAGLKMLTNLGDFQPPQLVGRDGEIAALTAFWEDEFKRVISIVGQGGVGKTALLDGFVQRLRERPCPSPTRPNPEAIIYLTAKENYLPYMQRAPEAQRFRTVHRIYEATLETFSAAGGEDMAEMRRSVLRHAREIPILFALDNLESISDQDWEDVREFLDHLPLPSKAIVTTREERRQGDRIQVTGLPIHQAQEFLKTRLTLLGSPTKWRDEETWGLDQLVRASGGVPLVLIHCANAIAHGSSIEETLERLRGQQFLDLMEFSFESTLDRLSLPAVTFLLYLALSRDPRPKKAILEVLGDEQLYDAALTALSAATFISQDWERKQQVRFFIENLQLKEYVKKRAKEILSAETYDFVRRKAGVTLLDAGSANVAAEVDRALLHARGLATRAWTDAIEALETARTEWGDDPRLLSQLGYYHYRARQLPQARALLEAAIREGQETADAHHS